MWLSSAQKGHPRAMFYTGVCYDFGQGTPKNLALAFDWYMKAAKLNDPKSLYNLGLCYKHGDGVNKSTRWATYYFQKALKFGHKKAKAQLKSLSAN